jgi:hypothetical protein
VFPTPERFRPLGRIPIVEGIAVEGNNRTFVRLAIAYAADGVQAAGSVYQLDAKLNPIDVEAGDQYMPVFRMLVRTGLLEGSADYNRRELWPMHVWAAGVFTPIEPAR